MLGGGGYCNGAFLGRGAGVNERYEIRMLHIQRDALKINYI